MQLPDIDDEGYLVDPLTWTEEIANEFASQENIQLTTDHWDAINFMGKWYDESQGRAGCPPCNEASCRTIGA